LDFISEPINLTSSVRQGDPIAMKLFLLYVEPLLLRMEEVTMGASLLSRQERTAQAERVVGVVEKVEGFVDDLQAVCGTLSDIINVDHLLSRFEPVSGAILNRSTKSKLMGLGLWRGKTDWPLSWVESVQCLKVFGIYLTPDWAEIIDMNWRSQLSKVQKTLRGWETRVLDTVEERVLVLDTFI
ncbi:MAG: hypothetical protein GY782_05335, partial [Gammaproteobacteria bacterium]|nr:hypothetical protein [Gammaproteobacteria bacterium]